VYDCVNRISSILERNNDYLRTLIYEDVNALTSESLDLQSSFLICSIAGTFSVEVRIVCQCHFITDAIHIVGEAVYICLPSNNFII